MDSDSILAFLHNRANGLNDFKPTIRPKAALLFISCLYFKGIWNYPFDLSYTTIIYI